MAKCYDNYSREELIELLNKQDLELANKKYGLVWDTEKEPEQVVLDCANNLPILERVIEKEIKTDDSVDNILIEGDNFHTLSVLNYTHKEKIDVIYIDPPYNTGKKNEWKYNDYYVKEDDGYRHSKWLNFMEKRLNLAKNLLKSKGVIFISIDDIEIANLKLLCNKIFGPENFVGQITREAIKGGSKSKYIRECNDYILIYAKCKDNLVFTGESIEGIKLDLIDEHGPYAKGRELNKWGAGSRREDSPSMWFPIKTPSGDDVYPIRNDGSEGRWRWGKKKLYNAVKNNNVIFEQRDNGTYIVYEKIRDNSEKIKQFTTLFLNKYINAKGAERLKEIFNTSMSVFDYAKPVELIYDLLKMANLDDDAIVLDFFAGSGTTAETVMQYNFIEDANLKYILCTNNENNICDEICFPRIEKIINGYNYQGQSKTELFYKKITCNILLKNIQEIIEEIDDIKERNMENFDDFQTEFKDSVIKLIGIKNCSSTREGLGGNLQYFKTAFIENSQNKEQLKINLTHKCTEMLCVKESIYNLKEEKEDFKIFESNKRDKYLCVYYNFIGESFNEFLSAIKNLNGNKIIYMFSIDDTIDYELFDDVENCKIESIPKQILDIYKKIIKENVK